VGTPHHRRCSSQTIEIQGDLESRNKEHLEGKFILETYIITKDGTPIMIIGHHILYGKVVVLDKPLVTLEKLQVPKDGFDSLINGKNDNEEIMDLDAESETKTEYMVEYHQEAAGVQDSAQVSRIRPRVKSRDLQKRKTS
jgi:hypothetical protein